MKKIKLLIILVLIPISFFINSDFAKAFNCNLIFLETDKNIYYINEDIRLNASWNLNYNDDFEYAYVQIQIYNIFDDNLWNSSEYDEIGTYQHNWTISIENLDLDYSTYSNLLYISLFYYYYQDGGGSSHWELLETIEITVIKRELSCELFGFTDHMRIGENISFNVRFYDSSLEIESNLINQDILFEIISNNSLIYQRNFTTDQAGIIEIFISSTNHLILGHNLLIFKITDTKIYNITEFKFEILLEKELLFIDVIEFKEILSKKENLEIELLFYYFSNNTIKSLNDTSITMKIFYMNNLTFINKYKTDKNGILYINITQDSFNSEREKVDLIIEIIFNGNYFLENKTLSLNLKITDDIDLKKGLYSQLSVFLLSIMVFGISIIIFVFFRNFKRSREKIITEITFRY